MRTAGRAGGPDPEGDLDPDDQIEAFERLVAHPDDDRARMLILAEDTAAPGRTVTGPAMNEAGALRRPTALKSPGPPSGSRRHRRETSTDEVRVVRERTLDPMARREREGYAVHQARAAADPAEVRQG